MASHIRYIRVVPAPNGFFCAEDNEYTAVLTMPKLTDELLSFQRSSRCPADCLFCGTKKGQLPPFQITFIDDDDNASPSTDQLVVTRCDINATRHFPFSIGYDERSYSITALGYSKQDFWRLCLAPLMRRVKLSSLPNLLFDWSHVQVLEVIGEFTMPPSSPSIPLSYDLTVNKHYQDLSRKSSADLLTMILASSTCQIFHLVLCSRSMENAGLFWDAVARCPTLSILTLRECDLLAETSSLNLMSPTPNAALVSPDNTHAEISSNAVQDIKSGNLQELTMKGCSLNDNSLESLYCLLRNTANSLQHVIMVNNTWPLVAGCKVVSSFMSHTQLESLDFTGLDADYATIQAIGQLMKATHSLQKLKVSECRQVIDVSPLADGLIGSILNELDLSNNRLINMGTLAVALHENQNLHTLNLSKITIVDDDDGDAKTENAKGNTSTFFGNLGETRGLKVLSLDEARLPTESLDELAQSLRINTSLDSLHLNHVGCGSVSLKSIFDSLENNKALRTLQIAANRLDDNDVNVLVAGLCLNRSLKSLTLARCGLTDAHLMMLGARLSDIQGLENLDLSFNSFGVQGVMALWKGLFLNSTLYYMSLFDASSALDGPVNFECRAYQEENELIQDLLHRNRDSASVMEKPAEVFVPLGTRQYHLEIL